MAKTETETTVFEEIATLLASPRGGSDAPALERLEDALTTGYAHALTLETERLRVERRLAAAQKGELHALSERLHAAKSELAELRDLLEPLKLRVSELRFAGSRR